MHHRDVRVGQLEATVHCRDLLVVPFLDIAQEDAADRVAVKLQLARFDALDANDHLSLKKGRLEGHSTA